MSRIGRAPITVPAGVEVKLDGAKVSVKGPKGNLDWEVPGALTISQDAGLITVGRPNDERQNRALHGLARTLVNNMVVGVTEGFRKDLEIVGVGYRANLKSPTTLELALGFSHPVVVNAPDGVTFETPTNTQIGVIGIDKELVGQVAANIRKIRKPEPYKGKGVRYKDERVLRKAGKTGK